jgi:NitT/TauT family transport system substrate-binding protein
MKLILVPAAIVILVILIFPLNKQQAAGSRQLRLAYFPNITHAQALIGTSDGTFQKVLGSDVALETKVFNAGPEEIEALLAGAIDIGYVGPSPAINGLIKSRGQALRIISGSASGGASLVLSQKLADAFKQNGPVTLSGAKIASPQHGNTQDVSLRNYLMQNGLADKTTILPVNNADQFTALNRGDIDGAWAPEPWASMLVAEAKAVRVFDERSLWQNGKFATTELIVRTEFLKQNPDLVEKFLQAQQQVTGWIKQNPDQARTQINTEIKNLTGKQLPDEVLKAAWSKLEFTTDPLQESVTKFADQAYTQKLLGESKPDLTNLFDLSIYDRFKNPATKP